MQFQIFYTQYDLFEEIKTGLSEGLFFNNKQTIFAKRAQNIKMFFGILWKYSSNSEMHDEKPF
jgi:hypothetical protein